IRGSMITVQGVLEPLPRRPNGDAFQSYLIDVGLNFRLQRGRLLRLEQPTSAYVNLRERWRARASEQLGRGLEHRPELAAALRGMLLGERRGLSDDQENLYLRSGTMHLFAISGLHIGVIAAGISMALRLVRVPSIVVFVLTSLLLCVYVDLTGLLPSAVRAAVMVICLHGALVFRAPGNSLAALAMSAVIVLLIDPMQLFGAGFQMSYGIVAALLLYGVPLATYWTEKGRLWRDVPAVSLRGWQRLLATVWKALQGSVAIGLAAALMSAISAVAFFGWFTPGSALANLPLIPMAGAVILSGLASLVCAAFGAGAVGVLFNHAAGLTLTAMQHVLVVVTSIPGTATEAAFRTSWFGEAAIIVLLITLITGYSAGWNRVRGSFWVPVFVVVLLLSFGMRTS
ncbi:MAG TPA: ComEC/Rec2 family competence protein, partial [Candidatus Synoicihabitans sp.]|nr:ComEC/Rec2 family competence protein [Candidatus Synoicihabitans sp.]